MFTRLRSIVGTLKDNHRVAQMLKERAADDSPALRRTAAQDPRTPYLTLCRLAGDADISVRIALARNPALPAGIAGRLCSDADSQVRYSLAGNRYASIKSLSRLATDETLHVASRATQTLETMGIPGRHRELIRH